MHSADRGDVWVSSRLAQTGEYEELRRGFCRCRRLAVIEESPKSDVQFAIMELKAISCWR